MSVRVRPPAPNSFDFLRKSVHSLALLLGAGLRRAECAALALSDYSPESREITVNGKGDKQRLMPLGVTADQVVRDWLQVRGDWSGSLLCRVGKTGVIEPEGISSRLSTRPWSKEGTQRGLLTLARTI